MREPKTPLPWGGSQGDDRKVGSVDDFARITSVVAAFKDRQDAAYAVHAANVLPEVLAALREAGQTIEALTDRLDVAADIISHRGDNQDAIKLGREATDAVRAALAKAEGAPEGGE